MPILVPREKHRLFLFPVVQRPCQKTSGRQTHWRTRRSRIHNFTRITRSPHHLLAQKSRNLLRRPIPIRDLSIQPGHVHANRKLVCDLPKDLRIERHRQFSSSILSATLPET